MVEEGGSSTGMTDFSGSPAGASEETEDNLSSVLGAGGPWRRGMEGEGGTLGDNLYCSLQSPRRYYGGGHSRNNNTTIKVNQ